MKQITRWILLVFALGLILSACGAIEPEANLDGTAWKLVTYRKNAPIPGTTPTLAFEDGKVSGNASCNSFGGAYQVQGENIQFGELFLTAMACMNPEGIMEQEVDYMQMLMQVTRFELKEGQLTLFFDAHETMVFVPAE